MLERILPIIGGVLSGIVTGLIPGVHVNLVSTMVTSVSHSESLVPLIVSLAITHSVLDVIPSILLGAPSSETALGVLPGHRYLLRGNGYMAIKLTLVGSYFGILLSCLLIPVWWFIIKLYPYIQSVMGWILLIVSGYMILRDKKRLWSLLVYALSGLLGCLILFRPIVDDALFPLFSGLFGVSTLTYSLFQESAMPKQKIIPEINLRLQDTLRSLGAGNIAGFLTSMLPGLGAAQAAVLGMQLAKKVGDHGFLVLLGCITTVNFSLSLLTWLALDKARNGAVIAMQSLTVASPAGITYLFVVAVIAASIAVPLCLILARLTIKILRFVPYKAMTVAVIVLLFTLVPLLTGWRGTVLLFVSAALGLVPAIVRCSRAHAMGCLMLPIALVLL